MFKTAYGVFNGNSWEDFCQQCFKKKHDADGYQEMPATFKGDLGIEGYTRTGILFQCYCPDMEYDPSKLYDAQRDKITKDLNKITLNQKELKAYLGTIKVCKWIFVTPGYSNKELVRHCREKAEEFRNMKLEILADDFDVLVHDIEFFSAEIPIVLNFRQEKLDIEAPQKKSPEEIADWKSKEISLVDNAIKKHGQRIPDKATNFDDRVNKLTQKSVSDFLNGDAMIRKWAEKYQDQYEKFQKVVDQFEKRIEEKCAVANGDNNQLYDEIEAELRVKIKLSFEFLDEAMIDRLTYRVMADWILRCPISFE
ncbi:MAG: hypothetical protein ABI663_18715 [Chryseolinea sp.]